MPAINPANSYYWAVLMKEVAAFKGWPDTTAHDWVKVTWNIKTTQGYTREESIALIKLVRDHVKKHWKLEITPPRREPDWPTGEAAWEEYCRSLEGEVI